MRLLTKRPLPLLLLAWLGLFGPLLIAAETSNKGQNPDVRVLIDISGSMKKNDPKNLRVPALQLITNLLPSHSDAGVWAFGRYVNMMVPLATVDQQWQRKATNAATKINSLGLYTNIGGVLEKASYGWSRPDPSEKRSMILLTDGMVDISKKAAVNAKERKRILEVLLPRLKAAGVALHTIALSENADHELMKTLSQQTDGWYQKVDNAEELEKVFLKIFEQAAARDSLPLNNNRFNVDASIDEMTVLVFRKTGAEKAQLNSPSGQLIKGATADSQVRWFSSSSYDLITVEKPEVGEWSINADVDPDNRVMVVSELGLNVAPVPNNLLAGEAINYELQLLEKGKVISKPQFLELVDAKLKTESGSKENTLAMFFDSNSSTFKQNFYSDETEGVLKLRLEVKSPTFERIRTHAINVYGSPLVDNVTLSDSRTTPHLVQFSVREDIVKAESLKINLVVTYPDEEKQFINLEDLGQPLELKTFDEGGHYAIKVEIQGQSVTSRDFKVSPADIEFDSIPTKEYLAEQAAKPKEVVKEPEATADPVKQQPIEPVIEKEEPKATDEVPEQPIEEPVEKGLSTMSWIYIGVGMNLILGVLGFFGWKWWKNKQLSTNEQLADELGIDGDDEDDDEDMEEVIELEDDDEEQNTKD